MLDIQKLQHSHRLASKNLRAHISKLVLLDVEDLQVRKPLGLGDAEGSVLGDSVVSQVELLEVHKVGAYHEVIEAIVADLVVLHAQQLDVDQELAEGHVLHACRCDIVVVKVQFLKVAHVSGLRQELKPVVSEVVARNVQQNQLVQGKRSGDKLSSELPKVVLSDLELLEVWNIAEVAELHCSSS